VPEFRPGPAPRGPRPAGPLGPPQTPPQGPPPGAPRGPYPGPPAPGRQGSAGRPGPPRPSGNPRPATGPAPAVRPGTPPPPLGDPDKPGKEKRKGRATTPTTPRPAHRSALPSRAAAPAESGTSLISLAERGWTGYLTVGRAWPLTLVIGLIAFAMRAIGLARANDLFVDELIYARIGNSVAQGQTPTFQDAHFYLHPIGSFLLDAGFIHLFGLGDLPVIDLVYGLRWLTAILGAITVMLGFRLLRKVVPLSIALGGAAVMAFDPFILRNDSRVMLETPATMWTLGAWLLLLGVLTNPATESVRRWREIGTGVVFGCALATKDMTIIQILVPLVLAIFWRKTLAPAQVGRIALGSLVPYALIVAVVTVNGEFGVWADQKVGGFRRLIGLDQVTGFHSSNVSLVDRLIAELSRFGTSYVLLGLCLFAGLGTVFAKSTGRRLMGLIGVSTGLFGVYSLTAGALEEQFGYYTVVVSVVVSATSIAELRDRRPALRRPLAVAGAVFVAATLVLGVTARSTVDDTYPQARVWMEANLPAGARVAMTGPVGELAFLPHDGWGNWPSLQDVARNDAGYVLTSSRTLEQGYGDAAPQMLEWLQRNAQPLFDAYGPTSGHTVVWKVDRATLDAAIARGENVPPVSEG
jgi:hypothetical protein